MSEVLTSFIRPDLTPEVLADADLYENYLEIATIAWNISLLSQEQKELAIKKFLSLKAFVDLDPEIKQSIDSRIRELIHRKQQHFSEYKKLIVEFELEGEPGKYNLRVASLIRDGKFANLENWLISDE